MTRTPLRHDLLLTEQDVAAARRVLNILCVRGAQTSETDGAPVKEPSTDRQKTFKQAELLLAMRLRRIEILGDRFSSEPPFTMLLALFVVQNFEPTVTATRLGELSGMGSSTTLRWLSILLREGWVKRQSTKVDRRKAQISLTEKSRVAMDRLLDS